MSSRQRIRRCEPSRSLLEALESRTLMTVTLDGLAAIYGSSITLPAAKTIVVPLTASNSLSGVLTYTVTASSPALVPLLNSIKPLVSANRTFVRFTTSLGNMDFQLFNDVAPLTTGYLLSHLNSPDFVNTIFHRIIKQNLGAGQSLSIIQGGDRTGTGSGSSPGVALEQELDPRLIYSGHGQLGEARTSQSDTGGSQFFVTLEQQRGFDFGYSIYGQLVRGWDVLTALNNLPTDSNDRPLTPPTLLGISVISDRTDAVLTLASTSLTPLTGTITVRARDAFGNQDVKTFNVTTVADTVNDGPFLPRLSAVDRAIPKNVATTISLPAAIDLEGNAINMTGSLASAHFIASASSDFRSVMLKPDAGYTGPIQLTVTATQANNSNLTDSHTYTFFVDSGAAPTLTASPRDVYAAAGGTYTFSVTYKDDTLVDVSKLIGNNTLVTVLGPNGYAAAARYVSIDNATNGASRTVTYRVTAPGGSWNAADAGAYTIVVNAGVVKDTLGHAMGARAAGTFYYSPSAFFSERYYLAMNPDIAAAVRNRVFTSGWQHFSLAGQMQARAASPYFNEKFYLALNPAVAAAVKKGQYKSGWQHFTLIGARQGLVASAVFNEKQYLAMYPDVAAAVASRAVNSGFEHFILHGQFEGRSPSLYFDLGAYATLYPSLVTAVNSGGAGVAQTLTEHFILYGQKEGRHSNDLFNEAYYLTRYPDIAAAVASRQFKSGFEHFILFGAREGRDPSTGFNSVYYLTQYPDVAAAVLNGTFNSAFEHYMRFGQAEGRLPHA